MLLPEHVPFRGLAQVGMEGFGHSGPIFVVSDDFGWSRCSKRSGIVKRWGNEIYRPKNRGVLPDVIPPTTVHIVGLCKSVRRP